MLIRFETSTRYYVARLEKDLLNHWIVSIAHGGKRSNLGRIFTQPVASESDGIKRLADISVRRMKRKYSKIEG